MSLLFLFSLLLPALFKCQNPNLNLMAAEFKLHDGPQVLAYQSESQELLYGGAVGGGKTLFLIMDAMGFQYKTTLGKAAIEIPGYRAVLFRRKSTEFVKLIEEGRKYYRYWGARFIWGRRGDPGPSFTFPSGARIFICHLESEDNKHDHDSNEYQYIAFDQLEQFTVTQYAHLLTRGRSPIMGIFFRVRCSCNWIGPGLKWARARFYPREGFKPYEITWWFPDKDIVKNPQGLRAKPFEKKLLPSGLIVYAMSRQFIPAKLSDNPTLMEADPTYAGRVAVRGEKYRQALVEGNPDAFSGDFFEMFNPSMREDGGMCVVPFPIPARWPLSVSIDPGWSSPFSLGLHAIDFLGNHYRIGTYYAAGNHMQRNVDDAYDFVIHNKWTGGRIPERWTGGKDCWAKHSKLAIQGEELTFADLFIKKGIVLNECITDRVVGWGALKNLMSTNRWFYFDGQNDDLIDEMQAAEHDDKVPEDILGRGTDPNVPDHAIDEERYDVMATFKAVDMKAKKSTGPRDYEGKKKKTRVPWAPGDV